MRRIKEIFFDTKVRLWEFLHYREVITNLIADKKRTEENAKAVINFLNKNGLVMILWEKERSWGENWCKISDRKTNSTFRTLNIIPPLKGMKNVLRAMKRYQKRKEKKEKKL